MIEIAKVYREIVDAARARGAAHAKQDAPHFLESPLSGEWAGRSIPELLGDLLERLEETEGYEGDWMDSDVLEAYDGGYQNQADELTLT